MLQIVDFLSVSSTVFYSSVLDFNQLRKLALEHVYIVDVSCSSLTISQPWDSLSTNILNKEK